MRTIARQLLPVLALPALALMVPTRAFAAAASTAETAEQKQSNLNDDINFSKDLARYRYFDLAVDWLAHVEKNASISDDARIELLLAKATIARLASDYALTRDERRAFFDQGIASYGEALSAMPAGMDARKAEATVAGLATLLVSKGKFYTEELDQKRAEEAPPDQLAPLRATAEDAFKEAVKTVNTVAQELADAAENEDLSEEDRARLQDLALFAKFHKGEAYFTWAQLYESQDFNREDYFRKAIESLEDFMWDAGEDNFFSIWAYYYQGMAEWELGRIEPEQALAHDERAIARLTHIYSPYGIRFETLATLQEGERTFVQEVAEKAFRGVAKLYRSAAARYEASAIPETEDLTNAARIYQVANEGTNKAPWKATPPVFKPALITALRAASIETVNSMESRLKELKLPLGPMGYYALLEKARALADRGEVGEALKVAKEVVENNDGNIVGYDGGILLAELSQQTDASEQPPSVLALIAQGFVNDGRTLDAIGAYHQVIAACKSDADKKQFGAPAWLLIGRGYDSLGRYVEAALAYEEGMNYALALGDDESLGDLASSAYSAWDRRYRETKDDFDQNQRNRVRKKVTDLNLSSDLQYFTAREAFSNALAAKDDAEKKSSFKRAEDEFKKVADDSQYYERALVYVGRCQAKQADLDGALATFDGLFTRAKDPKFAVALDRKKEYQRSIALAEATFYRAEALLDANRFDDVLATLNGYEGKFPKQDAFYSFVDLYRLRALVGLNRFDDAEALLEKMSTAYPKENNTTIGYGELAAGFFKAYDAIKEETPQKFAYLRKTAEYFAKHNARTGFGSFINLRNVADWYYELAKRAQGEDARMADLKIAEENYRRLFDKFGKSAAQQKALRDVKLNYARTLMALSNFADAEPLFRDLNAGSSRDREVVQDFARTLGGWLAEKDGQFEEIPGVGKHKEAQEVLYRLISGIEAANGKGSDDWWQARVDFFYNMYMESKQNPQVKEAAKKLFQNWETLSPDLGGERFSRPLKRLHAAVSR